MIYIKEISLPKKKVLIQVEGRLDRASLPALRKVCLQHLEDGLKVQADLSGLHYVGMEGREFLLSIKGEIKLVGMSQYLKQLLG
ncbi:MAG: STAS domain-containing protein [Desulfarculaceae bacterium]|nr:STAS domain-containing protein [Desulfarculaceae bacterium]MCF8071195.1 STAS domain-containing protein [Desulfarculaceae bacterium]MCF8101202.1 STAS domain-containing protein [Desulfarculaceae bacterium]MCF8115249.1 STAS domain-containing protein [Desulfarculaceae bacterium]